MQVTIKRVGKSIHFWSDKKSILKLWLNNFFVRYVIWFAFFANIKKLLENSILIVEKKKKYRLSVWENKNGMTILVILVFIRDSQTALYDDTKKKKRTSYYDGTS